MRYIGLVTLVGVVGLAGCGPSPQQIQQQQAAQEMKQGAQAAAQGAQQASQGAQQASQGAQQAAQGAQQAAQGLQAMLQGATNSQNANPVSLEALKAFMPDVAGWTKADVGGTQMTIPFPTSHAQGHYTMGNSRVTVEITDSTFAQMLIAPLSMFMTTGYEEQTPDGYTKSAAVGGSPGFEKWQKNSKHGEVTAIVAKRFIVVAQGDQIDSVDVVRKFVESIDLNKLAQAK